MGTAVTLDRAAVVRAEGVRDGRPDVIVVVTDQQPALPLEPLDQLSRERLEHRRPVGQRGRSAPGRRDEAREQHEARDLECVGKLVVHAHGLVGGPR